MRITAGRRCWRRLRGTLLGTQPRRGTRQPPRQAFKPRNGILQSCNGGRLLLPKGRSPCIIRSFHSLQSFLLQLVSLLWRELAARGAASWRRSQ